MRSSCKALLSLAFLAAPLAAHADSFETYSVSGTLVQGDTFSGIFTVETTTYTSGISGFDITTSGPFAPATFDASTTHNSGDFQHSTPDLGYGSDLYAQINVSPDEFFYLLVDPNTPSGASVCTYVSTCDNNSYTLVTSSLGYREPSTAGIASAPEPASLALLGTGLLGVAALTRRRRINA